MTATEFQNNILPAYGAMLAVACRMLGDREGASDAVQELMKKLWEEHERLDAGVSGAAYACRAVRNRCIDIIRCRRSASDIPIDSLADDIAEPEDNDDSVRMIELATAIDRLGEPRRTILRLSLDGKSGAEIAAEVGMTEQNVRQYLSRTRKELRKTILSNR
ncbi:MAG: RNA polymerase sigma factor [Muribaculaceae bacterium]